MSGRPYARTVHGFCGGGATNLNAFLPHRFRFEAPKCTNPLKDRAIRSVIRRRCREKNWKKLITKRHVRLHESNEVICPETEVNVTIKDENPDPTTTPAETNTINTTSKETNPTAECAIDLEANDAITRAKQELETLEAKLKALSDAKHEKFTLLKEILVQEARWKMQRKAVLMPQPQPPPYPPTQPPHMMMMMMPPQAAPTTSIVSTVHADASQPSQSSQSSQSSS